MLRLYLDPKGSARNEELAFQRLQIRSMAVSAKKLCFIGGRLVFFRGRLIKGSMRTAAA